MSKWYIGKQVKSLIKMKKEFILLPVWLPVGIYTNTGFASGTSPIHQLKKLKNGKENTEPVQK